MRKVDRDSDQIGLQRQIARSAQTLEKRESMHYQVVARPHEQDEAWDYYPYWAPVRDREAAIRLANYAAQDGYEAAILQSVTIEMLRKISHGVVDRQDHELLPALRFLPGAAIATASPAVLRWSAWLP